MDSALQLYNAALEPHEHLGHGLSLILPLALTFVAGLAIGRIMTRKKNLRRFQERLDNLAGAIDGHRRKVGKGVIWKMRAELALKSYLITVGVVLVGAVYLGYSHELVHCYEIPLGLVLIGIVMYLAKKGITFKIAYTQEVIRLLEKELVESKRNIIKELGPDMIQELKATEKCNKLCEDKKKAVSQDLERHKWLVTELSHFAWCEGCSRGSKCSGDCGGRYWRFTKETLRKFNSFPGNSNRVT